MAAPVVLEEPVTTATLPVKFKQVSKRIGTEVRTKQGRRGKIRRRRRVLHLHLQWSYIPIRYCKSVILVHNCTEKIGHLVHGWLSTRCHYIVVV